MQNKSLYVIIPAILVLGIGAATAVSYQNRAKSEMEGDLAVHSTESTTEIAPATGEDTTAAAVSTPAGQTSAPQTVMPSDVHVTVEGTDPKSPKSVGSIDAPVTMIEYSSLTCPHCAAAHVTVLPRLIKDYVETGKLRIVFSDFPLNEQAMDASKVSRCMGPDQYFSFITLLFSSIEQWAYSGKHPDTLLQNAALAGLPKDKAKSCLEDKDVEQALVAGVQDAVRSYGVNSTPTFVLNNGEKTVMGARPYEDFKAAIDELLAKEDKK